MSYYAGIDLGGTTIGLGILNENFDIIAKSSIKTPKIMQENDLISILFECVTNFLAENNIQISQIKCLGIGVPGQVNPSFDTMLQATNLGLGEVKLKELLEQKLKTPIYVCNDADAAAFGEAKLGGGKDYHKSVTITIGTGIGTGIIIGSEILPSEGGHIVIKQDGKNCNCGLSGCFEVYASTSALIEQTKEAMKNHPNSKLHGVVTENNNEVTGKSVFLAMEQNDTVAKTVFDTYINYLAQGIVSIANLVMPDVICLGGGISVQGEKLTKPLNEYLKKYQYPMPNGKVSKVVTCKLGNDAGIIGSALFALEQYKKTTLL